MRVQVGDARLYFDVEGAQLEVCREVLGPDIPIVASLDHHANVTRRMVELSTAIVGHRTQRTTGAGFLEKQTQRRDQQGRDDGGHQIFLVDHDAAFKRGLKQHEWLFGHAHVDLVNVATENGLAHAIEEIGNTQSGHQ